MECVANTLLKRAAEDLKVAKKLAQHPELGDSVVGFYLQQVVEKSLKVALAIRDVKFPMGVLNHPAAFDVGEAAIRWAEGMLAEAGDSPVPQTSSCRTPPPPPQPTQGLGRPETGVEPSSRGG